MATETSNTTDTKTPSREVVFDAVKNLRRRYVLHYLQRNGGQVELGHLAEQVAAWENDTTIADVSPSQRKSVYSALHQTHLPKLESAGILDYDAEHGVVRATETTTDFDLQLASDPHTSVPWHWVYLGLSGASLAVLAAVSLDVSPFSLLSPLTFALLVVAAFGATALAHAYDLRRWRRRAEDAAPDFILELDD